MNTGEDTGAPLEPPSGRVERHLPPSQAATSRRSQKEKLAEAADRHLRAIGAEVAALREELARLREEASERAELLVEREVVIAELSGLLPTLEDARVEALRQAENASAALVRTEARLSEQATRVTELQGRLATVEADTAARERLVADLEARLSHEQKRVATLEQELETLEAALARRVAGLSELEATVSQVRSEHEDVTAAIATDHPNIAAESSSLGHLRFVLRAGSYTVLPCDGEPPVPGQLVELDGERFIVAKIGRSPLPSDQRPCAYLFFEAAPSGPG